jgi:C1A family cysteine protease
MPPSKQGKGLGWRPDLPDARDLRYTIPHIAELPESVDLRQHCPPIYDQGHLGSCTAFAITSALEYQHIAQGLPDIHFSELFVYYLERQLEHTTGRDSGAYIRDGMKVVHNYGAPAENIWPYDIKKYTVRPSKASFNAAKHTRTIQYSRVIKPGFQATLASGMPIVFGFSVYESFMSSRVSSSGVAPMPDLANERVVGGHAVLAVGYTADTYICRNHWGIDWGQEGYFTLPKQYIEDANLCDDFWCMEVVE